MSLSILGTGVSFFCKIVSLLLMYKHTRVTYICNMYLVYHDGFMILVCGFMILFSEQFPPLILIRAENAAKVYFYYKSRKPLKSIPPPLHFLLIVKIRLLCNTIFSNIKTQLDLMQNVLVFLNILP